MKREQLEPGEIAEIAFRAEREDAGSRLDKFVFARLAPMEFSRSAVQQWIKHQCVTVNGKPVKANYKLKAGDSVYCDIPAPVDTAVEAEPIPLAVVYEDEDMIVVDKPYGMVVHPAAGHPHGTLVNALLYHCGDDLSGINGERRPGIVHRIDKDTSGLLVAAKNDAAHRELSAQLQAQTMERKYYAIVHGDPAHDQGTIDAPIGRDKTDRKKYTVTDHNSKQAITHFVVRERFREAALLEASLQTGRTHQIRVHMKFIGHPIVGDPLYGRTRGDIPITRQALHAATLAFKHPRHGEKMRFTCPLPEDIERLLAYYRARL